MCASRINIHLLCANVRASDWLYWHWLKQTNNDNTLIPCASMNLTQPWRKEWKTTSTFRILPNSIQDRELNDLLLWFFLLSTCFNIFNYFWVLQCSDLFFHHVRHPPAEQQYPAHSGEAASGEGWSAQWQQLGNPTSSYSSLKETIRLYLIQSARNKGKLCFWSNIIGHPSKQIWISNLRSM